MMKQWKDTRQQWQDTFHCSEHLNIESWDFGFSSCFAGSDFFCTQPSSQSYVFLVPVALPIIARAVGVQGGSSRFLLSGVFPRRQESYIRVNF